MSVGEAMGGMSQKQQQTSDEIGPEERITPTFKILRETLNLRERATILKTKNIAGETLLWGHSTFGIWNTYKWGSAAQASFILGHADAGILGTSPLGSQISSPVVVRVVNPNQEFIETFRDSTFEDTTNTTATWDTTNFRISFTAGQIAQTKEIFLNNQTIISAKPKLTIDSGSIKIELSANGGTNWQTFTNNTESNFTTTGTDLRLKLTENGSSTAQVSEIKVEYTI